jgi:hypothetical protein
MLAVQEWTNNVHLSGGLFLTCIHRHVAFFYLEYLIWIRQLFACQYCKCEKLTRVHCLHRHEWLISRVFDEISFRENFAKLATKRFSCFAKMGDEFREFRSFAKLPILRKKRVSRNTKIAKTKKTWSKKSSLEIVNWFCEESIKSKPNHHVNARYRVDTKWPFKFFAKYNYRFLLDIIIAIIATFFT